MNQNMMRQMQNRLAKIQEELASETVEATAGGGVVMDLVLGIVRGVVGGDRIGGECDDVVGGHIVLTSIYSSRSIRPPWTRTTWRCSRI